MVSMLCTFAGADGQRARVRVAAIHDAEAVLAAAQSARAGHIAGEEHRHRQLQITQQQFMQPVELF